MFIFSKLMSLCGLIAGVYILKLKNWARKLQITLRLISIAFIIFTSRSLLDKNMMDKIEKTMEGAYDLSRQKVIERYKPEHQEEEIKKLEFGQRAIAKGIPIILFSTLGTFIIWEMLIIFFFTRSKVKEQFD